MHVLFFLRQVCSFGHIVWRCLGSMPVWAACWSVHMGVLAASPLTSSPLFSQMQECSSIACAWDSCAEAGHFVCVM